MADLPAGMRDHLAGFVRGMQAAAQIARECAAQPSLKALRGDVALDIVATAIESAATKEKTRHD